MGYGLYRWWGKALENDCMKVPREVLKEALSTRCRRPPARCRSTLGSMVDIPGRKSSRALCKCRRPRGPDQQCRQAGGQEQQRAPATQPQAPGRATQPVFGQGCGPAKDNSYTVPLGCCGAAAEVQATVGKDATAARSGAVGGHTLRAPMHVRPAHLTHSHSHEQGTEQQAAHGARADAHVRWQLETGGGWPNSGCL